MPRRPSPEVLERDAKCAGLYCKGFSLRQIMPQVGLRSTSSVSAAIRRHAKTAADETLRTPEVMQMMLDRLQDYRRLAWRAATTKRYVISASGRVVTDPDTGNPLVDMLPAFAGIDRLVRIDVEEYKLRGMYAPAQARIEVVTQDMIETEIRRLEAEVALNPDPDHSGTT